MIEFLNFYIKDLSFFSLYFLVFLRSIAILVSILFLQRTFLFFFEKILKVKAEETELISPFGSLFFPFLLFIVKASSSSFLIIGWLKPKSFKKISFLQNIILILLGTFFYLAISYILKLVFFDILMLENFIEDNLFFWFLEPVARYAIKLSFLMFVVNFLPVYPFEFSKLITFFFKDSEQSLFYFKILSIIIVAIIAFNSSFWHNFELLFFNFEKLVLFLH